MSPANWRIGRQIILVLERDIGRTDHDLARVLGVSLAELRPVTGTLYRQRKVDRCWDYLVLPWLPGAQERAA